MGNVKQNTGGNTLKVLAGGGFGSVGDASEFYSTSFESGTLGASVAPTDFVSEFGTTYNDDIVGPIGSGKVAKVEKLITEKYFGGPIVDMGGLGEGAEVWCKWAQYFPAGFVFANGVNGDGGGSAGRIKWMRFQYTGGSDRITMEADATSGFSPGDTGGIDYFQPETVIGENMDWVSRYGGQAIFLDSVATPKIALGTWHELQMYIKLSVGDSVTGDGTGVIRSWIDSTLISEDIRNTLPVSGTSSLESIYLGNYWNGGFPQSQKFYIDDIKILTTAPATLDASGNPYIAPA